MTKYFRVRSMIQDQKTKEWNTNSIDRFLKREEAQKRYDSIYKEWKKEIKKKTFILEMDEF